MPRAPYRRARIYGGGAMGTSLALALRERSIAEAIEIVETDPGAVSVLRELGLEAQARADAFSDSPDLVVLATPPRVVERLLPDLLRAHPEAILTDLTSVKRPIIAAVDRVSATQSQPRFVGSHPLAGTERSGPRAGRADRFVGAPVALCAGATTETAAVGSVERLWQLLGAVPIEISAEEHDRTLALTSHLPYVVSSLLARRGAAHAARSARTREWIGPGFRDTARVAASPVDWWEEILTSNADELQPLLEELEDDLRTLRSLLRSKRPSGAAEGKTGTEGLRAFLKDGASFRRTLEGE